MWREGGGVLVGGTHLATRRPATEHLSDSGRPLAGTVSQVLPTKRTPSSLIGRGCRGDRATHTAGLQHFHDLAHCGQTMIARVERAKLLVPLVLRQLHP